MQLENWLTTYRHFTKENMQMANDPWKKCWPSLNIREMTTKITIWYHNTMAKIKNRDNNKCWWGCRETGSRILCWWECERHSYSGKVLQFVLKTKHATTLRPSNGIPGHLFQRNENLHSPQSLYTKGQSSFIYEIQKLESTQRVYNRWMVKQTGIYLPQTTTQ